MVKILIACVPVILDYHETETDPKGLCCCHEKTFKLLTTLKSLLLTIGLRASPKSRFLQKGGWSTRSR
jgi:hypothetical protein